MEFQIADLKSQNQNTIEWEKFFSPFCSVVRKTFYTFSYFVVVSLSYL